MEQIKEYLEPVFDKLSDDVLDKLYDSHPGIGDEIIEHYAKKYRTFEVPEISSYFTQTINDTRLSTILKRGNESQLKKILDNYVIDEGIIVDCLKSYEMLKFLESRVFTKYESVLVKAVDIFDINQLEDMIKSGYPLSEKFYIQIIKKWKGVYLEKFKIRKSFDILSAAIDTGNLSLVKLLYFEDCEKKSYLLARAVKFPDIYKYLLECGCVRTHMVLKELILAGRVDEFKASIGNQSQLNIEYMEAAAIIGNVELMEFLSSRNCPYDEETLISAIEYEQDKAVDWCLNKEIPFTLMTALMAVKKKNRKVIMLCKSLIESNQASLIIASKQQDVEFLYFMYNMRAPLSNQALETAVEYGNEEVIEFYENMKVKFTPLSYALAIETRNKKIMDIMRKNKDIKVSCLVSAIKVKDRKTYEVIKKLSTLCVREESFLKLLPEVLIISITTAISEEYFSLLTDLFKELLTRRDIIVNTKIANEWYEKARKTKNRNIITLISKTIEELNKRK